MCWADPIDLSGFKTGGSADLRQALTPSQILDWCKFTLQN